MLENQKIRPAQVIGPLGEPLTLEFVAACRAPRAGSFAARPKSWPRSPAAC